MKAHNFARPAILMNENERLEALKRYEILDTQAEQRFDDLTELASYICNAPIALVSLVDKERQWFKSKVGVDAEQTPREWAFCAHAINQPEQVMVVQDALQDPRFVENPLVTGDPNIRFYAGAPLVTHDGYALGTLCVIDTNPRELTQEQLKALSAVRRQVLAQIELSHNLTELSQANLALEELNRTNNDFLRMAAHDLKNPLSAVKGYAEELMEISEQGDISAKEALENAQYIHQASAQMYDLIVNLLDSHSVESEKKALKLEVVTLSPLFERLQRSYAKRAHAKQIELVIQQPTEVEVLAIEFALSQVLDNLISNAIKYSPRNKTVTLHSQETEKHVKIFVHDQGPGFSSTDKQRLFQKFTRLSARPTGGEHSSGLGLFIVKNLVEAMQAKIVCESELGQGAKFVLELPKNT